MGKKPVNDWPYLSRKAAEEAEALAMWSNSGRLPTSVGRIAEKRLVKRIRFRPLLAEGTISTQDDGFQILVACESSESQELEAGFLKDLTGRRLPHRVRFTLAHEIAHTFFFDIRCQPPKSKVRLDNPKSKQRLEVACQRIAGTLLLPAGILEKLIPAGNIHNPDTLSKIANTACVSKSAFISRFLTLKDSMTPRAILMSARSIAAQEFIIEAVWRHYSFRQMFPELQSRTPLCFRGVDMNCLKPLQIFGGSHSTTTFNISLNTRTSDEWKISVEPTADAVSARAFVIALTRTRDFGAV